MYYIVSMKHTQKRDRFITLWGKDNRGYYTSTEGAGLYENPEKGYHDSPPDSIPIKKEKLDKLTICVNQAGADWHCVPNCKSVWDELGFKWNRRGDLILK